MLCIRTIVAGIPRNAELCQFPRDHCSHLPLILDRPADRRKLHANPVRRERVEQRAQAETEENNEREANRRR